MFNPFILQHWSNPYHRGIPELAQDGVQDASHGKHLGVEYLVEEYLLGQEGFWGQGPYMSLAIALEGETIRQAWFETYACPAAIACGSRLSQWLEGKTLVEAALLTEETVSQMVGGLPLGKEHCARIAVRALKSALRQKNDAAFASIKGE